MVDIPQRNPIFVALKPPIYTMEMPYLCCKRPNDCSQCPYSVPKEELFFRQLPLGHHFPAEKTTRNCILFMTEGELLVNSEEYPGITLHAGECILQAIGSKMEFLALTHVKYLIYYFTQLPLLCESHYHQVLDRESSPLTYTPLPINRRLQRVVEDIIDHLQEEEQPCNSYLHMKSSELVYILTNYYPLPQASTFFYPISSYTESFHYFVMQNYLKVKSVEEFAHLGGYGLATFRRLFKNMYGAPVYEWILNKKREGILDDLQHTKQRISAISSYYGFDNLSHFAHFCQHSFGDTPRSLRKRLVAGEIITFQRNHPEPESAAERP